MHQHLTAISALIMLLLGFGGYAQVVAEHSLAYVRAKTRA